MRLLVDSKIREVDRAIGVLVDRRRQCTDPIDVLITEETIDELLDDRLHLMRSG